MSNAVSGIGNVLFGKKQPPAPSPTSPASRAIAARASSSLFRKKRDTRVSSGSGQGVVVKKTLGSGIFLG